MTIPTEDAVNVLRGAEAAAGRSQAARGYQHSSLYLILWGVIWIVANVASQASAHAGIIAWNVAAPISVLGSVAIGLRQAGANRRGGAVTSLLIALAVGGFGAAAGGGGLILGGLWFRKA